jgi:phosphohistidine phosphatase SixA
MAPVRPLIVELNRNDSDRKQIVLVGHEPFLSRFFSHLLSGETALKIDFKKGALAKLTVEKLTQGPCATLNWFLTPKQLRALS